jgi:uncharacterized membrane protein YgdD (TMEM256/DUF423 family)
MNWPSIGALLLALAVILGAFGAHGLRGRVTPESMDVYQKAVFYHFIHALGILAVSILPKTGTFPLEGASTVCAILLCGIVLFSGSLYLLAVTGKSFLGMITPLGGLLFVIGWVLLAWRLRRPV